MTKRYMKGISLIFLAFGFCTSSYGQKMEVSLFLNSGLSKFGGKSAAQSTSALVNSGGNPSLSLNNPYGGRYSFIYGGALQAQLVTPMGFLAGAQYGAERLQSQTVIDAVQAFGSHSSSTTLRSEGEASMKINFMNLQPYMGWRVNIGKADLDITMGTDIGFPLQVKVDGKATLDDNMTLKVSRKYSKPGTDVRPRIGLTAYKGHIGASVSYAHGLTNHQTVHDRESYMRVFRAGMLYRM